MKLAERILVTLALVAVWIAIAAAAGFGPRVIHTGLQLLTCGGYGWPAVLWSARRRSATL